jgi:hypothetical protein
MRKGRSKNELKARAWATENNCPGAEKKSGLGEEFRKH